MQESRCLSDEGGRGMTPYQGSCYGPSCSKAGTVGNRVTVGTGRHSCHRCLPPLVAIAFPCRRGRKRWFCSATLPGVCLC